MIDTSKWFVIVRKNATRSVDIGVREVTSRILKHTTMSLGCPPLGSQPCTIEYDGEIFWRVTYSERIAPDGEKRIAYVLGGIPRVDVPWFDGKTDCGKLCKAIFDRSEAVGALYGKYGL